jgi:long-chain acyl-CoA synthetase
MAEVGTADTFARILLAQAHARPEHAALRQKALGIWQTWTWREVATEAGRFGAALLAAGVERGQPIAIIGRNRPQIYFAMLGAQAIGAVPVPLHDDETAAEIAPLLKRLGVRFAFAENQEQVDKLLQARSLVPGLADIVYLSERGLRRYQDPGLRSCEAFLAAGEARQRDVAAAIEAGRASDVAVVLHTSGTTGETKIGRLTHGALLHVARAVAQVDGLTEREEVLAYLPLAWVKQHLACYAQWLHCGFTINCPESGSTVDTDLRDIGPTYHIASPRSLEALLKHVTLRMEDASAPKRRLYRHFLAVAARVGAQRRKGESPSFIDGLQYALGNVLMYAPLRDALGMTRIRVAHVAGEAIGEELYAFFRSIGINLQQVYGATEAGGVICLQRNPLASAASVGQPIDGIEVRVSDSGELLVRGPTLAVGVADDEGWFHTGDAARIDTDGEVCIIDRQSDLLSARGVRFSPKEIESRLRFPQYIREAVVFSDGRDSVVALINVDFDSVRDWAERQQFSYSGYTELVTLAPTAALIGEHIADVNRALSATGDLSRSQIRRFAILHKELDPDDQELTRTLKLRRSFVARKYDSLVQAMHAGASEHHTESAVLMEDGREGLVSATLVIHQARTFDPPAQGTAMGTTQPVAA